MSDLLAKFWMLSGTGSGCGRRAGAGTEGEACDRVPVYGRRYHGSFGKFGIHFPDL